MDDNNKQIKEKAYTIIYLGLFSIAILAFVLIKILPDDVFGLPKFFIVGMFLMIIWFVYITKLVPRCSKCGMGVFSVIEIYKVPIIVKGFVGSHCAGCGAKIE